MAALAGATALLIAPAFASAALDFKAADHYPAGNQPHEVEVLDANRDGVPDLAVGAQTLNLLTGTGVGGSFAAPAALSTEVDPANGLVVARLNGDRKSDLAVLDEQFFPDPARIGVLLSRGDGSFRAPRHFRAGDGPNGLAVGDFDDDGNRDLATAGRVLFGRGDGTFGRTRGLGALASGNIAAGDLNGDGHDDLVAGGGEIALAFGRSNRKFRTPEPLDPGLAAGALDIADVDGDGRRDIGVAHSVSGNDSVSVVWRKRRGFATPTTASLLADVFPQSLTLADLNGDGLREVATGNVNDTVSVFEQTSARVLFGPVNLSVGDEPQDIEAAMLDDDDLRDLVTADNLGDTVSVLINEL